MGFAAFHEVVVAGQEFVHEAALERLEAESSGEGKDVLNALARAQLEAQENPKGAMATLEGIDLDNLALEDYYTPLPETEGTRLFEGVNAAGERQ